MKLKDVKRKQKYLYRGCKVIVKDLCDLPYCAQIFAESKYPIFQYNEKSGWIMAKDLKVLN